CALSAGQALAQNYPYVYRAVPPAYLDDDDFYDRPDYRAVPAYRPAPGAAPYDQPRAAPQARADADPTSPPPPPADSYAGHPRPPHAYSYPPRQAYPTYPPQEYRQDYSRQDFGRQDFARPDSSRPGAAQPDLPTGSINPGPRPPSAVAPPTGQYASLPPDYRPEEGNPKDLPPQLRRQIVDYRTKEPAGTLIVDTANTYLYMVLGNGQAMRYGIGVGREGFTWAGDDRTP